MYVVHIDTFAISNSCPMHVEQIAYVFNIEMYFSTVYFLINIYDTLRAKVI